MCFTTLTVIQLAIALLLRPSNCYGTWCNAPEVFVGETAKITFYMDNATKCIYLEGQFIHCSSLEVQFINSTNNLHNILDWNTSNHNFSINGNYHYMNKLPDHLELNIPNVMHNHSGNYSLTHMDVEARPCTLIVKNKTVPAWNTSNQHGSINEYAAIAASANQTPITTVSVVIAVLVTFGVTLAVITVVVYISYKYRCLFFKHRVTTQYTSEHADNGRPLMPSAVNNDHVPY